MGRDKTGRPIDNPIGSGLNVTGQDFERRAPIIPPGTISYIYSGEFRTTTKTASFTLSTEMVVLVDATACSITLTLPPASANRHKVYYIKKVDIAHFSQSLNPGRWNPSYQHCYSLNYLCPI